MKNRTNTKRAFSTIEALITLAVLATTGGVAVMMVSNTADAAKMTKLEQDVVALNSAVRVFKANGGTLADNGQVSKVLAALKTKADAATGAKLAGLRGSMIDQRTEAVTESLEEASSGKPKVLWDSAKQRFYIARTAERGVKSFTLNQDLAESETLTQARSTNLALSASDGWVWDFTDSPTTVRNAPRTPGVTFVVAQQGNGNDVGASLPSGGKLALNAPVMSGAVGGTYDQSDFPKVFSVANQNPGGTAVVKVSTNGMDWATYTGPISVGPGTTIYSYSESQDATTWNNSEVVIAIYGLTPADGKSNNGHGNNIDGVDVSNPGRGRGGPNGETDASGTIDDEIRAPSDWLISGYASGLFRNPTGDANLVSNLIDGNAASNFTWGTGYSNSTGANRAGFYGSVFDNVGGGQRFLLGNLEYHNGTTFLGTNATAVDFSIDIAFAGSSYVKSFDFNFGLFSTPNNTGTANGDADYFRLSNIQSSGSLNINGLDYRLELAFGKTTKNGFSTIDEFRIHENKTGYGELWGKLVRY